MAQKIVYVKTAAAVPGQLEMGNQDQFSAVSYVAASALTVGHFCFEDSTDATKVNAAGTAVVGLVPFVRQYATAGFAASMIVPPSSARKVAIRATIPMRSGQPRVRTKRRDMSVHCASKACGRPR